MRKTKINSIIIDDDSYWQLIIKNLIKGNDQLSLLGIFSDTQSAYEFLAHNEIDLIFLDVQIENDNGIELIKKLKNQPHVIIISSFAEFAIDGYSISAIDYLTKPIDFTKFDKAVRKAINSIQAQDDNSKNIVFDKNYFLVKENLVTIKLNYNEVIYITALENYIKIVTSTKTHIILSTMLQFERSINNHPFLRVHRSYIINLNHLNSINKDILLLSDETQIPLSEQYKSDILELFVEGKIIKR